MNILRKLKRIETPSDIVLLLEIVLMAALLPVLAQRVRLPKLVGFMDCERRGKSCEQHTCNKIVLFTNYVLSLRIPLIKSTCLIRSLVLFRLLRRAGMDVCLNIGVGKRSDQVVAHSWISDNNGTAVADPSIDGRYQVIYSSVMETRE